jgi:antitoxin component of MazEF toxin-antitoxin module
MKTSQRFRKIKKWGNSLVVVFNPADVVDLCVKDGDYFDISEGVILSEQLYNTKIASLKQRGENKNIGV